MRDIHAIPRSAIGRVVLIVAIGYVVLAGVAAFATGTSPTAVQVVRGGAINEVQVVMTDTRRVPRRLTVGAGDTVTWLNRSTAAQTIMIGAGGWESALLEPGESYSHTFTTPGTYRYTCGRDAEEWRTTITVTSKRGPPIRSVPKNCRWVWDSISSRKPWISRDEVGGVAAGAGYAGG